MPEIQVLSSTEKTAKTGRPYKSLEVFADGEKRRLNIFSNAPDFANIRQGSVMLGTMSKNGEYWDITFDGAISSPRASQGFKQAVIEKTMEKKEASIQKFQDSKELSIMTASSMTNAVNLAIAEYKDKTVLDTLDQAVLKWRRFIIENWELNPKDYSPFND